MSMTTPFPEPEALLTPFAAVPGLDGRKMSKSYENEISLSHTEDETRVRLKKMFTDPQKLRKGDPVTLVLCGAEHKVLLRNVAFDPEKFDAALSDQEPAPETLDRVPSLPSPTGSTSAGWLSIPAQSP